MDLRRVLPALPGTASVTCLNRLCRAPGLACRTKPVIATARRSNGNRARKLKKVIAAAYWLPLVRPSRCHAMARWRTAGRFACNVRQRALMRSARPGLSLGFVTEVRYPVGRTRSPIQRHRRPQGELGAPVPAPVRVTGEQHDVVHREAGHEVAEAEIGLVECAVGDMLGDGDVWVVREVQRAGERTPPDQGFELDCFLDS